MHVLGVCRSIVLTSLRYASEDFGIPNFGQLFHARIEEHWGHKVSGLVLGYDQNVLIDTIFIKLLNGLLYYHQPFHNPTSVERLGLDFKVERTKPMKGSCLMLITSGSSIRKVKRMTSITPSKDEFIVFLYYTSAGLHRIRSSNVRSPCLPG